MTREEFTAGVTFNDFDLSGTRISSHRSFPSSVAHAEITLIIYRTKRIFMSRETTDKIIVYARNMENAYVFARHFSQTYVHYM